MALSNQPEAPFSQGLPRPLIEEQLRQLLASKYFRTSRRCSAMLEFVIVHRLDNPNENLKERTIGVEVFQRPADYETATDPVVRTTAGEIRKRLAQNQSDKVMITLPAGCYQPVFIIAPGNPPEHNVLSPLPERPAVSIATRREIPVRALFVAGAAVVALIAALVWVLFGRMTLEQRFWKSLVRSEKSLLICLGDGSGLLYDAEGKSQFYSKDQSEEIPLQKPGPRSLDHLTLVSVIAGNQISSFLAAQKTKVVIQNAATTSLADLRDQPVVLIGARTNQWTMRTMKWLPYQLVQGSTPDVVGIVEAKHPADLIWTVDSKVSYEQIRRQYAIVARINNPAIQQPTLIIAGAGSNGTIAGASFLTSRSYLKDFLAQAPRGWENHNVEVILETQIVNGDQGPPHVLKVVVW